MRVLPPKVSGALPVVGHSLEFLRDPVPLIERGYREHGKISMLRVGGRLLQALDLELVDPDPKLVRGLGASWPQHPAVTARPDPSPVPSARRGC